MKKYICTGNCKGESEKPGTCGAETCEKFGQALVEVEIPEKRSEEEVAESAE